MGVEVREMLEFVPAKLIVIEERLTKCVCKKCAEGVVMGKATPKPIEGARPGPGLLAKLLVDKFDDSTPLYRQAKEWRRLGAELSTSTMGDWVAGGIDLLEPLWKFAKGNTLVRVMLSLDDTHLPVLDRDHPAGIKKGHLWAFIGDFDQVMFYEYTPTWEGEGPRKILAGFKGKFVQADGYAGIDQYFERPDAPVRVGCLGHCRRKFVAALDAKDMRAAVPISLFAQLYAIEAKAREDKIGPDELLARRQSLVAPIDGPTWRSDRGLAWQGGAQEPDGQGDHVRNQPVVHPDGISHRWPNSHRQPARRAPTSRGRAGQAELLVLRVRRGRSPTRHHQHRAGQLRARWRQSLRLPARRDRQAGGRLAERQNRRVDARCVGCCPEEARGRARSASRCRLSQLRGFSSRHPSCPRDTALCGAPARDGQDRTLTMAERDLDGVEKSLRIDLGRSSQVDEKGDDYYPQFTEVVRRDASTMAQHYEILYALEQSMRALVRDKMLAEIGPAWWDTNVPEPVKVNTQKNIDRERESGVTMRSSERLDYTTFGELGEIVRANWQIFGDTFNSEKAFSKVMTTLNLLRGPIAHCSTLAEDEVVRLRLALADWFRLME